MKADSPAATSGGSGWLRGCAVSFTARCYQSTDVMVACRTLECFLRDARPYRRIELRERPIEGAVLDVAAGAGIARRQRAALGGVGGEEIEHVTVGVLRRIDEVDLVVGE